MTRWCFLLVFLVVGCGTADSGGGDGEPCRADGSCESSLQCVDDVCVPPDARPLLQVLRESTLICSASDDSPPCIVDFGTVQLGSTSTAHLVIHNAGRGSMDLQSPTLDAASAPSFRFTGCGTSEERCDLEQRILRGGESSRPIAVEFAPRTATTDVGAITFVAAYRPGGGGAVIGVELRGTGP
ncbi:MAG: hypothetical protein AB2A00_31940 [Myxococcota bacterium]